MTIHVIAGRKIRTEYWQKPIPERNFDWQAVDDNTYNGPTCPIGHGTTEAEAVDDLFDQLSADEDDCPRCFGTGRYSRLPGDNKPCALCDGTGQLREHGGQDEQ